MILDYSMLQNCSHNPALFLNSYMNFLYGGATWGLA